MDSNLEQLLAGFSMPTLKTWRAGRLAVEALPWVAVASEASKPPPALIAISARV
ncbi:MAG: hypothetical protein IT317_09595 [Anaerolineales bacterium]|nr:hypothetical protein [Anaerolineales bacterium]